MSDDITYEAAERMATTHNEFLGLSGGKLVFDRNGRGGAWWQDTAYDFGPDVLILHMHNYALDPDAVLSILNWDNEL